MPLCAQAIIEMPPPESVSDRENVVRVQEHEGPTFDLQAADGGDLTRCDGRDGGRMGNVHSV